MSQETQGMVIGDREHTASRRYAMPIFLPPPITLMRVDAESSFIALRHADDTTPPMNTLFSRAMAIDYDSFRADAIFSDYASVRCSSEYAHFAAIDVCLIELITRTRRRHGVMPPLIRAVAVDICRR